MKPIGMVAKEWGNYTDYFGKQKRVGKYIVELVAGHERGGMVRLWLPLSEPDVGIGEQALVGDQIYSEVCRGDFMENCNARDRYNEIKTLGDISSFFQDCM